MTTMAMAWQTKPHPRYPRVANAVGNGILYPWVSDDDEVQAKHVSIKGSSQHKVDGEWFEIKLGKISRMLVKYEVLPIPNVIFVC